jgi:hypothetical protein
VFVAKAKQWSDYHMTKIDVHGSAGLQDLRIDRLCSRAPTRPFASLATPA